MRYIYVNKNDVCLILAQTAINNQDKTVGQVLNREANFFYKQVDSNQSESRIEMLYDKLTFFNGHFIQTHLGVVIGDLAVRRQSLRRRIPELKQQKLGMSTFGRLFRCQVITAILCLRSFAVSVILTTNKYVTEA